MAYSWFSHCKKYLAALEEEKRFVRTTKARFLTPPTTLTCLPAIIFELDSGFCLLHGG